MPTLKLNKGLSFIAPWAPLVFFCFIGESLASTHGHYNFIQILEFVFFFGLYLARIETPSKVRSGWLVVTLFFMAQLFKRPGLIYVEDAFAYARLNHVLTLQAGLAMAMTVLWIWRRNFQGMGEKIIAVLQIAFCVASVAAHILVLKTSPNPTIDAYSTTTRAVDFALAGVNPYAQTYPDIYQGRMGYSPTFGYWPGLLYWLIPFRYLGGDIRFGYVAALVGIVLLIYSWGRRHNLPLIHTGGFAVLWLSFPVTLFVLEQSWIDVLLCFQILAFFYLIDAKKWLGAGCVLGWCAATKQYGVIVALLACAAPFLWRQKKEGLALSLSTVGSFGIFFLPSALYDWPAFHASTIQALAQMQMRADSFSLPALFLNSFGIQLEGMVTLIAAMAGLIFALLYLRKKSGEQGLTRALVIFFAITFLFGKQAFCNYYYFLAFLILTQLMVDLGREPSRSVVRN